LKTQNFQQGNLEIVNNNVIDKGLPTPKNADSTLPRARSHWGHGFILVPVAEGLMPEEVSKQCKCNAYNL